VVAGVTETQPSVGAVREDADAAARIEQCEVMDVNYDRHTVDVWSEFSNRRVPDVEMACMYCHPDGEDGGYVMPEPGAMAVVVFTSDGNQFVVGYYMPQSEALGSAGIRPKMNPGDLVLATRDHNRVVLRRGGVVEVSSTPLAQRFYIPMGNLIHDVFEQWKGTSIVGEFSWLHDPIDPEVANNDPEKDVKVLYTWKTREKVQDEFASIELRAGHVDDEGGYVELKIAPQGGDQMLLYRIKSDGSIEVTMKGTLKYEADGAMEFITKDSIKLSTGGFEMTADSGGATKIKASAFEVDGGSRVTMKSADHRVESPSIKLGAGASEQGVKGNKLVQWLMTHGHTNGGAGPPDPASLAKLMSILSTVVRIE
jgi:hypothetical protein